MTLTAEMGADIRQTPAPRAAPREGRLNRSRPAVYVPKTLTRSLPWCLARYSALSALLSSSSWV